MRNPLDQALHDAQSVSEWMNDNKEDNETVGFATAWAEIQAVIRYLSASQPCVQSDLACTTCGEKNGYHKTGCSNWLWQPSPVVMVKECRPTTGAVDEAYYT
jgi:hypothetical protein